MANEATYDFALLSIVFGGVRLTGFADADSYQMAYDVEKFTRLVGGYGLGAWAKSNNYAAGGSITLLATSRDNLVMQTFFTADGANSGGILVPLVAIEQNGGLAHAGNFRITKAPDIARGTNVPVNTWMIGTTKLYQALSGSIPPEIVTSVAQAQALISAASKPPNPV